MKKLLVIILSIMLLIGSVSVCTGCGGGDKTSKPHSTVTNGDYED